MVKSRRGLPLSASPLAVTAMQFQNEGMYTHMSESEPKVELTEKYTRPTGGWVLIRRVQRPRQHAVSPLCMESKMGG